MSQTPDNPDVYMSGALSAPPEETVEYLKSEVYNKVYKICNEMGISCYCPHKSETVPSNPMPHGEVWDIDYQKVTSSDVVIAYVGIPALGVGAEIEVARAASNDIILLSEYKNEDNISRLILGNPQVKSRLFFEEYNLNEIEGDLKRNLFAIFSEQNRKIAAFQDEWSDQVNNEMQTRLNNTVSGPARAKDDGFDEPMSVDDWIQEASEMQGEDTTDQSALL